MAAPGSAPADPRDRTRIRGTTYLGDLPTLIADREGLFARAGIDADVAYDLSGKRNLERLRAGDTDFALMALTPPVIDLLADPNPGEPDDPVILASVVHSAHLNHIVAPVDGPIHRPPDLPGHRLGVVKGTNAEFVWWLFATYHGLDPDSVELVDLAIEALAEALVNHEIDAAVSWEPWTSRLDERIRGGLHTLRGSDVYIAKWVVATTRSIAEGQRERCRAVLTAYRDAIEFTERHPEKALRLYAEHTGVTDDVLRRRWDTLTYGLALDWSIVASVQQQLDWARRAGYASAGAPPEALDLFEPGPLRAVATPAVGLPAEGRIAVGRGGS